MNIVVEYKIKLPVPCSGSPSVSLSEEFKMSSWTGYNDRKAGEEGSEIVYITDHGTVYHEDYQCTYLQLSINYVPFTEAEEDAKRKRRKILCMREMRLRTAYGRCIYYRSWKQVS